MPTFKKYHHYVNKNYDKKDNQSRYIKDITPTEDLDVPKKMYDDYEDITKKVAK